MPIRISILLAAIVLVACSPRGGNEDVSATQQAQSDGIEYRRPVTWRVEFVTEVKDFDLTPFISTLNAQGFKVERKTTTNTENPKHREEIVGTWAGTISAQDVEALEAKLRGSQLPSGTFKWSVSQHQKF
jgi:hypothetical protein